MTIGSAQKGPGPMPSLVAGLLISIIVTRWLGWKAAILMGACAGFVLYLIILLLSRSKE